MRLSGQFVILVILGSFLGILVLLGSKNPADLGTPVPFLDLIGKASWKLILTALVLIFAVGFVVALRRIGDFPTEFDRTGSDLNLYGYGIGLSFVFGVVVGRRVLSWIESRELLLLFIVCVLLLSYLLYGINLFLSRRIRELKADYSHGVDSETDLGEVLAIPAGRRLIMWSFFLGFVPTLIIIVADIFSD